MSSIFMYVLLFLYAKNIGKSIEAWHPCFLGVSIHFDRIALGIILCTEINVSKLRYVRLEQIS